MTRSRLTEEELEREILRIIGTKDRNFDSAYTELSNLIDNTDKTLLQKVAQTEKIRMPLKRMLSSEYSHAQALDSYKDVVANWVVRGATLLQLQEQEKKLGFDVTKLTPRGDMFIQSYRDDIDQRKLSAETARADAEKRKADEKDEVIKQQNETAMLQNRTIQLTDQINKAYLAFKSSGHTSANALRAQAKLNASGSNYEENLSTIVSEWFNQYNDKLSKRTGFFGSKIQTVNQFVEQLLNKKQKGHHYSRVLSLVLQAQIINNEGSVKQALVNLLIKEKHPNAENYASEIINQLKQATIKVEGKNKKNYAELIAELPQLKDEKKRTLIR